TRFSRDWSSDVCSSDLGPMNRKRFFRGQAGVGLPSYRRGPGVGARRYGGSGPELAFEALLRLFQRALVGSGGQVLPSGVGDDERDVGALPLPDGPGRHPEGGVQHAAGGDAREDPLFVEELDRKSTRLNSSHVKISYAVFCLKKK